MNGRKPRFLALCLSAEADAFELRHVAASIDPAVHGRRHVRRYRVSGDTARRMPPVAESVRDFVDEWIISLERSEGLVGAGSGPRGPSCPAPFGRFERLGEFASVRACETGLTQVEIGAVEGASWFFIVSGGDSGPWMLERVARAAAGCTGRICWDEADAFGGRTFEAGPICRRR